MSGSMLGRLLRASVLCVAVSWSALAAAQPQLTDPGAEALARYLRSVVEQGDVPGAVAIVVDADRVLFRGAYGMQNLAAGVPMQLRSIFRIASMTKPITSVCAMMLIEEGRLGLDDPAARFEPKLAHPQVFVSFDPATLRYTSRPASRDIVVRDLLTHTSGLGYAWSNEILNKLVGGTPSSSSVLGVPLVHDPGARWTYGEGPRVVGTAIEQISGEGLGRFMRERVFEPLGMRDTGYAVPAAELARVVTVHQRDADGALVEQPNAPALGGPARGDGGLYSTADDYARFLQMLLRRGVAPDGTRLLAASTVERMGQNQIGELHVQLQPAANRERARPYPLGAGRDRFGFGFQIAAAPAEPGLRSAGSLSWAGIDNTEFWIDPSRGVAAVLLMQFLPFYDAAAIETLQGFERRVYAALE